MEEYIKLQAEKARRRDQTFNWETTTHGKIYCDNLDFFTDFEANFLAIVYNDALTSNENVLPEPTDSFSYKLIPVDDLKPEPVNDHVKINTEFCSKNIDIKPMDNVVCISDDTTHVESDECLETNHDKKRELSETNIVGLLPRDQRHLWLRYEVNQVHLLDFEGLMVEIREALTDRGSLVHEFMLEFFSTCRPDDNKIRLDIADTLCFQLDGFEAYWAGSLRGITDKGDLSDYWARISLDGDFLRVVPSYTSIRNPLKRLCHRLIAVRISGRGQAPEKYLFRYAEGRKRGARLSGGYFVGRLAKHFGLVMKEGLQGLTMVVRELKIIDMDDLVKLHICERLGDTWALVAPGPKRQQVIVAGALEDVEGAQAEVEGVQADPAPVQEPQPPLVAASTRTMVQRMTIL
ncbi:hypothetical protein Tco_0190342 [Tanacetum coccineum]